LCCFGLACAVGSCRGVLCGGGGINCLSEVGVI
jgi:hypothetical protein